MKKYIALILVVLSLCASLALADNAPDITPDIDYEGTWVPVAELGFQLYLPNDWVLFVEEPDFTAGNEQVTQYVWIEAHESKGYNLDDVMTEFSQKYEDVQMMVFSETIFVSFKVPKSDIYCGVALSPDESLLYFFKFIPAKDTAFVALADKIMSSYSLL